MAPLKFARAIFEGRPIEVFGEGDMRRDFTFIDDGLPRLVDWVRSYYGYDQR